ncbi:Putative ferroportin-domain family protein [Zea mays]|uniref:Putative ferroportin-domain family protein n=1 Tax=Zea mays TaxID=4577 RepID=A0A1D6P1P2_MAIZE|nr:Putative ferroportin-domain family protein [Zea mays]
MLYGLVLQLRHADDGDPGLGRHTCVRHQFGKGLQRHRWHRRNAAVPCGALMGVHTTDRTVVHLDAMVLPAGVRRFHLGGERRGVGVDADGRRRRVAPRALDVRPRRDAADAGWRARPRALRRGRGAEFAAVRVRSAHLYHGHHHLRPQGFQRAGRVVLLPGDLRCSHVHAARLPRAQAPLPLRQDPSQDQLVSNLAPYIFLCSWRLEIADLTLGLKQPARSILVALVNSCVFSIFWCLENCVI